MISRDDAADLLDVNVLIALAWPNHVHHERAHAWFAGRGSAPWATCPVTQSGFVRVSSHPLVSAERRSPIHAIELLRRIVALPGHVFWEDDVALSHPEPLDPGRIVGHRQVTDAHLLALALRRGGRLATFDRGLPELAPDRPNGVTLIR